MWWSVPDMSMARVGEHAGAVWKFVMRMPVSASLSRVGVRISPPYGDVSLKPRSSATTMRKLGRFGCDIVSLCSVGQTINTEPLALHVNQPKGSKGT